MTETTPIPLNNVITIDDVSLTNRRAARLEHRWYVVRAFRSIGLAI